MVTWAEEGLSWGCETGERLIRGRGEVTEVGDRRGTVSRLVQGIAGNRESETRPTDHLKRNNIFTLYLFFCFEKML